MADFNVHLNQNVSPRVTQRTVLLGRVKMAQAIKLPEAEWAKLLSEVERDPLFQELLGAQTSGQKVIKYKRYGRCGISGQFYEMQDVNVAGGSGVSPESLIDQKKHLLTLIQRIGQDKFEKYFLYKEESVSPEDTANICAMTLDEVKQLNDFILNMSVLSEFYHPSMLQGIPNVRPTLVGRIVGNDDETFSISFFSPHMARGTYEINHAALRSWQKNKKLDRQAAARLRRYIGILELSNMKQGAFFQVFNYILQAQKAFLSSGDLSKMAPISLRHVARDIRFAPSTISRVMSAKSVMLPWEKEVLITYLMPGQRRVLIHILDKIMGQNPTRFTDAELAQRIADDYKVKVSRRTITACRHAINLREKPAQAA